MFVMFFFPTSGTLESHYHLQNTYSAAISNINLTSYLYFGFALKINKDVQEIGRKRFLLDDYTQTKSNGTERKAFTLPLSLSLILLSDRGFKCKVDLTHTLKSAGSMQMACQIKI